MSFSRVAFVGSLVPLKGAHVLLDAWERLSTEERAGAALTLYGPDDHEPEYVRELELRARQLGVGLPGSLARKTAVVTVNLYQSL